MLEHEYVVGADEGAAIGAMSALFGSDPGGPA